MSVTGGAKSREAAEESSNPSVLLAALYVSDSAMVRI
jgi:hypothetical protein